MPDLFPAEPVMRLWALYCVAAIGGVIAAAHLVSHAADHLARRRAAFHPAAMPSLVPLEPGSFRDWGRIALGHQQAPHALNAPRIGEESRSVASQRRPKDSVTGEENSGLRD